MRNLKTDTDGFMVNISAGMILGYVIIMVAMAAFWLHRIDWLQDGIMGTIWGLAPFIFAGGWMVILVGWGMSDPKVILAVGAISGLVYWALFMM